MFKFGGLIIPVQARGTSSPLHCNEAAGQQDSDTDSFKNKAASAAAACVGDVTRAVPTLDGIHLQGVPGSPGPHGSAVQGLGEHPRPDVQGASVRCRAHAVVVLCGFCPVPPADGLFSWSAPSDQLQA